MSNWTWTHESLQLLARDWDNNLNLAPKTRIQRMTEFHLCQPDDVRAGLRLLGINPDAQPYKRATPPKSKPFSGAAKDAAMAKLEAGIPAAEVAELYGISPDHAENLARRVAEMAKHRPGPVMVTKVEPTAIPAPPAGKRQRRRYDRETIAKVTGDIIDNGLTYIQAAKKHHVPSGNLPAWVKAERERRGAQPPKKEKECMKKTKNELPAETMAETETQTADLQPNAAPDGDAVTCTCQAGDAAPAADEPAAAPMISAEPDAEPAEPKRVRCYRRYFTGVVELNNFGDILLNGEDLGMTVAEAFGLPRGVNILEQRAFAARLDMVLSDLRADQEVKGE